MGKCVVRQPNGLYAVFSSIVDDFVVLDCTPAEVVSYFQNEARRQARKDAREAIQRADDRQDGDRRTWDDCLGTIRAVHGKARAAERRRMIDPAPASKAARDG